jgi:predicted CXXCH cytochrome family protein
MLMVLISVRALAGDWHYGVSSVCSDCHTQHNSANGQPMRTDNDAAPAAKLLRRGTPLELCLSCHDGSNPNAPDVLAPVSYVTEPAGGWFPNSGGFPVDTSASYAHHLNTPSPVIPPGGTKSMTLVCTSCHDPHGNNNYRNLKTDPSDTNQPATTVLAYQPVTANGSNPALVYVPRNITYKSGISAWCSKCHGTTIHQTSDHPVERTIWNAAAASYASWVTTTLPRVPVQSPMDNNLPSQDDQVFCLSCHKAHGSNNPNALIYADGTTRDSTCQQCHNQ